jgi:hypothetical protein
MMLVNSSAEEDDLAMMGLSPDWQRSYTLRDGIVLSIDVLVLSWPKD